MSITKDRKSNDRRTIDVDERDWSWFINGPPRRRRRRRPRTTSLRSYRVPVRSIRVTTRRYYIIFFFQPLDGRGGGWRGGGETQ